MTGTRTPIAELHKLGLTFHKTTPLRRAGHTTVEDVAELVAEHRATPDGSRLSTVSGMGTARITAVCDAIDRWNGSAEYAPHPDWQQYIDGGEIYAGDEG
ncbi:hypothetical protein [Saccharopolyspora taberi]|uniref:Uncharacterized protein n=1 Tax=Saccharopolyspora taberi TaxID=60895 RepID=A0ABN3UZY7_9PSEU